MSRSMGIVSRNANKTAEWIKSLQAEMNTEDKRLAMATLRAVFQSLRDRLTLNEMAHVSAQLPVFMRGLFFEGWRPSAQPTRESKREQFLMSVYARMKYVKRPEKFDLEAATRACLRVIGKHVSAGEMKQVEKNLPADLRKLFSEERWLESKEWTDALSKVDLHGRHLPPILEREI